MGRPYLLLGAVTAGWGTIPVLAGLSDLPSPLIVAIRLWTAAVCLGAVLLVQRLRADRTGPRGGGSGAPPPLFSVQPVRCVLSAAVLGGHWLALFAAYHRAPAGTVILIVYLAPIGVAALAPRLLGERLGRAPLVALIAATMGFALLAAPAVQSAGAAGLVLSLVAAVLFVALIVLSKRLASAYGGLRLAFMELGGAGVMLIPVALATAWPPPARAWLWIVALGVVHTALGITLYLRVLAQVPATHVGILSYLEPVVVVLAAWLWLGQRPALAAVAGAVLVVGAGVSVALAEASGGRRRRGGPARARSSLRSTLQYRRLDGVAAVADCETTGGQGRDLLQWKRLAGRDRPAAPARTGLRRGLGRRKRPSLGAAPVAPLGRGA